MHIFCDESGGHADGLILVSALSVEPIKAKKVLKRIKKVAKHKNEIKGHQLTACQRKQAFDIIFSEGALGVVSVCCRETAPGNLFLNPKDEKNVWGEMIAESCCKIIPPATPKVFITPDAGRYKKHDLSVLKTVIADSVSECIGDIDVTVSYGDSQSTDGVQLADIIVNTVYQSKTNHVQNEASAVLIGEYKLNVFNAELGNIAPDWAKKY
ncbi:DUF3800 domain-containing protein [Kiloniella sp. b19]|uniref:DUF3800 domain-containing protein n=1 Tax=Kiloniella sp. GXU_MW_B19 TaxID=3141326 RepID=UPI0031D5C62D